jgi:hypothetical protein
MGPPVRPRRRPHLQKIRTSRAKRVLGAAAMDATVADGGVTMTSGAGIENQPCLVAGNLLCPPVPLLVRQRLLTARQGRNAGGP